MTYTRLIVCTIVACAVATATLLPTRAHGAETVLRGASCFPKGAFLSRNFEAFVQEVNERGGGVVRIRYVGGAPAIGSPFQLVDRVSKGVFDMAGCTGSYYQNVLPEAEALKLIERSPAELRRNGGMAYLNRLHHAKNLHVVARLVDDWPFYLFVNKRIEGANLEGLHLRTVPIYTPFFRALGATTQDSNIAEIFTLMENGTVQGFGWPVTGFLPDWYKVTKFRVEPGFYEADIHLLINRAKWQGLPAEARKLLQEVALKHERAATRNGRQEVKEAKEKARAQGVRPIVLKGDARKKWVTIAREVGWKSVIERSPNHGPELRRLLAAD